MQTQTDAVSPGLREISRSLAGAVILATLGVVAAFVSAFVVNPLYAIVESEWKLFGELIRSYIVQPGFGLVAAGYIWWRNDYNPLNRMRVPSVKGAAWVGLGMVGYEVAVRTLAPVVSIIEEHSGSTTAKWRVFLDQPEIIVPGLVVMFVVMVPMEELLYRGVVHDMLEPAIGTLGRVLAGGLLFGVMHFFFSGDIGSLLITSILGILLGAGYERTENLLVPILAHAGYWLVFLPY